MAGPNSPNSPPKDPAADYAMVARLHGGRRTCPRRLLPDNRWTFDVTLRRAHDEVPLGRWTFGRHLGEEEVTAAPMHRLGHAGRLHFEPVGWPRPGYFAELKEIRREIEAPSAPPGDRPAGAPRRRVPPQAARRRAGR